MSSPDEISKLRDELRVLDGTIQAERNEEIRHALQRGRLEAERAQLLVKIMEAVGGAAPTPLQATPYRVVVQQRGSIPVVEVPPAPPTVPERRRLRPHGIPYMPDMILGVLKDALKGLVARQIIDPSASVGGQKHPQTVFTQRLSSYGSPAAPKGTATACAGHQSRR